MSGSWKYLVGDAREVLRGLPEGSVQTVVTSPPYYGLRDYGVEPSPWGGDHECAHDWDGEETLPTKLGREGNTDPKNIPVHQPRARAGQYCRKCGAWFGCLGLEPTVDLFVEHLVEIFEGVKRVLRDDGILWLNLGDSYASGKGSCHNPGGGEASLGKGKKAAGAPPLHRGNIRELRTSGLKPKDLIGLPWMTAFALRASGWYLRKEIIWHKPNPMPESVPDRPTSSHEHIFMMTKSARYFYDGDGVREKHAPKTIKDWGNPGPSIGKSRAYGSEGHQDALGKVKTGNMGKNAPMRKMDMRGRHLRDVWTITTQNYEDAHFATFPERIPETCIKASTSERGACPRCGAPWRRELEQINPNARTSGRGKEQAEYQKDEGRLSLQRPTSITNDQVGVYKTVGWTPSCECPAQEAVPCVVLDPFAGSGTTVLVARRLGRSAIGIDINPEYRRLAEERAMLNIPDIMSYAQESPAFTDITENEEEEK